MAFIVQAIDVRGQGRLSATELLASLTKVLLLAFAILQVDASAQVDWLPESSEAVFARSSGCRMETCVLFCEGCEGT